MPKCKVDFFQRLNCLLHSLQNRCPFSSNATSISIHFRGKSTTNNIETLLHYLHLLVQTPPLIKRPKDTNPSPHQRNSRYFHPAPDPLCSRVHTQISSMCTSHCLLRMPIHMPSISPPVTSKLSPSHQCMYATRECKNAMRPPAGTDKRHFKRSAKRKPRQVNLKTSCIDLGTRKRASSTKIERCIRSGVTKFVPRVGTENFSPQRFSGHLCMNAGASGLGRPCRMRGVRAGRYAPQTTAL